VGIRDGKNLGSSGNEKFSGSGSGINNLGSTTTMAGTVI
jgi:hypothetical protein